MTDQMNSDHYAAKEEIRGIVGYELSQRQINNYRSREIGKLAGAMSKAQGAMKNPAKTVPGFADRYHYAPIEDIIEALRVPFSENGLSFVQRPSTRSSDEGTYAVVETILMHESDQWISSTLELLIVAGEGDKMNSRAQILSKHLTSLKRTSLMAMTGIAQEDMDPAIGDHAEKIQGRSPKNNGQAVKFGGRSADKKNQRSTPSAVNGASPSRQKQIHDDLPPQIDAPPPDDPDDSHAGQDSAVDEPAGDPEIVKKRESIRAKMKETNTSEELMAGMFNLTSIDQMDMDDLCHAEGILVRKIRKSSGKK